MSNKSPIPGTSDNWESGVLGNDAAHAKRAPAEMEQQIDASLGLQAISIRLPKATIDTYKLLAKLHGVGYQPLMRDAICRWAEGELKQMLIANVGAGAIAETPKQKSVASTKAAAVSKPRAADPHHRKAA